jgi:hypothetical protein
MPADAPGVTTDDQGSPPNGGGAPGDQSASTGASAAPDTGGNGASSDRAGHTMSGGTTERDNRPVPGVREPGEQSAAGNTTRPHEGSAPGISTEPGERSMSSAGAGSGAGGTGELTVPAPASPPGEPPAPGPVPAPAGLAPGAEPPPAPVLVPPPSRLRGLRRGRHASGRVDRAARRGLRVNQRLWSISPWSVFKVSALFYLCVALIVVVAGTLLYNAGRSVGTIDQFESFITRMGAYGECVPTAEVPQDAVFETDDKCDEGEVLVGGFAVDDGTLFRAAAIGAVILVVAGSIGNVLLTVLLNLLNELTGGVRHTIIREPVPRPPASGPSRQGGPGRRPPVGAARPASGSPRPRLQR